LFDFFDTITVKRCLRTEKLQLAFENLTKKGQAPEKTIDINVMQTVVPEKLNWRPYT